MIIKQRDIRHRLLALVLLPLLLMLLVMVMLLYLWTTQVGFRHLLMKVSTDLSVANTEFRATEARYLAKLSLAAQSADFRQVYLPVLAESQIEIKQKTALIAQDAMQQKGPPLYPQLNYRLQVTKNTSGLDFVQLLDVNGCVLASDQAIAGEALALFDRKLNRQLNHQSAGQVHCEDIKTPLYQQALTGVAVSGVELFTHEQLSNISAQLAQRASLKLTETERAKPVLRRYEKRGMLLHFVYPLTGLQGGEVIGFVRAGLLVNGSNRVVDQIKETVYGPGSLAFGSVGTVTIFLQDVRISTNVPAASEPGRRALGTRVSEQVREKVLQRGERWLDRAFVVSDWYISGYQPIMDIYGRRIGMIYAGFLEAPFEAEFYRWMWQLLGIFFIIIVVCAFWVVRGAKGIFKPIESMVRVISKIRSGQRERINLPENASTELLTLGVEFNLMLDQLEQQHDHIQSAAEQLEVKVAARTAALNQHIQLVKRTREQLIAKGKLAAIGELTAGIAHEINNPTAVILGYLDLMVMELGSAGDSVQEEVQLIVQQVERIRQIINDLLQFSRPADPLSPRVNVDLNPLVKATEVLIKHDLVQKDIQLVLDLKTKRTIFGHRSQLQQVLINLLVNAIAAIEQRGKITVRTRDWRDQRVLLTVRDNGCGIAPEVIDRIFDPFFSKTSGGTGLGLSVSYSLLQAMHAEITVRSRLSVGTVFYIWLPAYREKQNGLANKVE